VRVGHDGSLGCERVQVRGRCLADVAGVWRVRSGTGTGFCFKAVSAHWADYAAFGFKKVQRWQMA
jgi:hypothetical protein